MTNADGTQARTTSATGAPDKPVGAPTMGKDDSLADLDADRRLALFAVVPLLLLASPLVLPIFENQSFWEATRYDPMARPLVIGLLSWPVCLGLMTLVQGLRCKTPGKLLLGFATPPALLYGVGGPAFLVFVPMVGPSKPPSMLLILCGVAALGTVITLIRSFFRTGWQRLNHFIASLALLTCLLLLTVAVGEVRGVVRPAWGMWMFMFAAAALLPFVGVTITARKV